MISLLKKYNASILKYFVLFLALQMHACHAQTPIFKADCITEKAKWDTDDPAIWYNAEDPSQSLILGTDKDDEDGGLLVYNLEGKLLKRIGNLKRPNNIDIDFILDKEGKREIPIAILTERGRKRIRIYRLPDFKSLDRGDLEVFVDQSSRWRKPMGIAIYQRPSDQKTFVIITRKKGPREGYLAEYELFWKDEQTLGIRWRRYFGQVEGEAEAIAIDDRHSWVFYSDEDFCIRKYNADPDAKDANQELGCFGTRNFDEDREGIALDLDERGRGYIVVSDQNANRMRIFLSKGIDDEDPHDHPELCALRIDVKHSDGSDIYRGYLNAKYPEGILVSMSDDKTFHIYSLKKLRLWIQDQCQKTF